MKRQFFKKVKIGKKITNILVTKAIKEEKKRIENNRKQEREYQRKYILTHKESAIFWRKKRRIIKANAKGSHTLDEWKKLKKLYGNMCLCCKRNEPEIKLTEDHIIPLSRGGSDYIWNIQPLCRKCNSIKNANIIDYREVKLFN